MARKKFINKKKCSRYVLTKEGYKPVNSTDSKNETKNCFESEEERKAEQRLRGIYFDDDYDYLQHVVRRDGDMFSTELCPMEVYRVRNDENSKNVSLVLPLPDNEGTVEMDMIDGIENCAIDPEIAAALEGESDFEELEDDFIVLANADSEPKHEDLNDASKEGGVDLSAYSNKPMLQRFLMEESCRVSDFEKEDSALTDEGELCSISGFSKPLRKLDELFENTLGEYDSEEIGSLNPLETEGVCDPVDYLTKLGIDNAENKSRQICGFATEEDKAITLNLAFQNTTESKEVLDIKSKKLAFDCESILSFSTTNSCGPSVIRFGKRKDKPEFKENSDTSDTGTLNHENANIAFEEIKFRPKNESSEEKKLRKAIIKEMRKENRLRKKATKLAYRREAVRTAQELANIGSAFSRMKVL